MAITYREYLLEAEKWYTMGKAHVTDDGPAVFIPKGSKTVFIDGKRIIIHKNISISEELQKKIIIQDIENIKYLQSPSKETQEYVIKNRPDLIGEIDKLDPELAKEYKPELNLSGIEI